ncbi:hypothetical protein [Pseudomonas gingeri]|uniref:Aspartyl protease n=1 Tax=Pseudomonas gingeri TaxID=117681 RepID=A0A7Y8CN54_9PSED|nr:hypothetical protein [Pseudomonas gingeri]NWB32022.1 hypothetical protein [Pseudomonas gingeri]NWC37398.1 hypothetical protein [Pseudomonas gingeri]
MPATHLVAPHRIARLVSLTLLSLLACIPEAFAQGGPREVIPIHATVMSTGNLRYSVPLNIGGVLVETMLDTGSVGLRVMPGVLQSGNARSLGEPELTQYSSGVRLQGELAQARVGLGHYSVLTPIQVVQSASCNDIRPHCIASKVPSRDFLMGGNPQKGEGYKAILGIGMFRSAASNPLIAMGGRWIVVLPKPGESTSGQLIINPSNDEVRSFRTIRLQKFVAKQGDTTGYWRDHNLRGCLQRRDNGQSICGNSILDTGAPGFIVFADNAQPNWPNDIQAHFSLTLADGSEFGQHFKVAKDGGRFVHFLTSLGKQNFHGINSGLLTFFDNYVLYDQNAGVIGLRSRG